MMLVAFITKQTCNEYNLLLIADSDCEVRRLHHLKLKDCMKYKVAPWVQPVVDYFWSNKANITKEYYFVLDNENRAGVPDELWDQLSSDIVEFISDYVVEYLEKSPTRTAFAKHMVEGLSSGTVIIIS